MPRSKNPTRYPSYCFAIAEKLEKTPSQPIEMPCPNLREANSMKLTFNCWKGAALDSGLDESRFYTLKDMVARVKEDPIRGVRVEFRNINIDSTVAQWNKILGLDLIDDLPDPPAYMRK